MMIDLKMEKSDEIVGEFLESVAGWWGVPSPRIIRFAI